jgi:hypothetical protein
VKHPRLYNHITNVSAALLLLLFFYTAISKLMDLSSFSTVLGRSPLLKSISGFIAIALPATELVIAVLLFFPGTKSAGLLSSFVLMLLLTGYLIYMVMYSPHLPCSCGGVLKGLNWNQHIVFNLFFTLLAFAGWQCSKSNQLFIAINNRRSRKPV